jgi:hypothetical protein
MSRGSSRPRRVAQLLDEAWASRRADLSVNFHSQALSLRFNDRNDRQAAFLSAG